MYAKDDTAYVATFRGLDQDAPTQRMYATTIHVLGLTSSGATYRATGAVGGNVNEPSAMDAASGLLRVVAKAYEPANNGGLFVLAENGASLTEVGHAPDCAPEADDTHLLAAREDDSGIALQTLASTTLATLGETHLSGAPAFVSDPRAIAIVSSTLAVPVTDCAGANGVDLYDVTNGALTPKASIATEGACADPTRRVLFAGRWAREPRL